MKYLIMIFAILLNILTIKLYAQSNLNTEKCIPCEKLTALKIPYQGEAANNGKDDKNKESSFVLKR